MKKGKQRERERNERESKMEEKKRKKERRRERLLEKTALVLDEDKVRRMIGSELETQIHLWRKRVSERKIPLNGKVQEKKERVIALIREKKLKLRKRKKEKTRQWKKRMR